MNYPHLPRMNQWERKDLDIMGCKWIMAVVATAMLFLVIFMVAFAHAQTPCPANLWKGLIAEDVSGGYQGMYAVACCVRNRINIGMNHGLVAMKRKDLDRFVSREGVKYELMAKDIVRKVFEQNTPDITQGATHYESVRYKKPYWAYKMQVVCQVGEHIFYKEVRR